jgi:hypothetical protein
LSVTSTSNATIIRAMRYVRLLLVFSMASIVLGCSGTVMAAATISRPFTLASPDITIGSLVSAVSGTAGAVELANTSNGDRLVGPATATTVTQVQVAISGTADILASTLSGDIHPGDQVSVSPLNGIGMKALSGTRTIGVAQGSLTDTTNGTLTRTIADKSGGQVTVRVGHIPVAILIGYAPSQDKTAHTILDGAQGVISVIAGHTVTLLQTVLSLLICLIAIAALVALVYGAIRGSLISLGRNPLAGKLIMRSLSRVIGMALLIAAVSTALIYFTLR